MIIFGRLQPALWAAFFFSYLSSIDCTGVLCYYCTVAPKPGAKLTGGQICSRFKENIDFQVFCPNSTLCMKRSIHHRLGNGSLVVTSVERGCAPQLHTFREYDYEKRDWFTKYEIIKEAYDEGCSLGPDKGTPGGPPEFCFCSYHLCNGSLSQKNVYTLTGFLASLVLSIGPSFFSLV